MNRGSADTCDVSLATGIEFADVTRYGQVEGCLESVPTMAKPFGVCQLRQLAVEGDGAHTRNRSQCSPSYFNTFATQRARDATVPIWIRYHRFPLLVHRLSVSHPS